VLWTASVANGSQSSPAVTSDGVYLSYSCPNVYKLNPTNGALVWRYSTGCSGGGGKTPALYNGRLYVRDYNPDYIFDSVTGGMAGTYTSKHVPAFSGNMGFFLNGPKGFGSFGTLEGRDVTNNNSLVWSFTGDGSLQSSVLVVNDYVYVGSNQGRLYAVEAANGHQAWTTNVGVSIPYVDEQNSSQPLTSMAAGEGILVVPTQTTLVAYEGDHTPTMTWGTQTPVANGYGWNNTPVDLPFTAAITSPGVVTSNPESPLHFTAEGAGQTQQVTVTDQVGNSTVFTSPAVNIDWTAPVTTLNLSGTMGNGGWYKSSIQISLSSFDALSGNRNTYYKVDSGTDQTYVGPFSLSSEGSHTVSYRSVDAAGNSEAQQSVAVNVDVNAPATTATVSAASSNNGWNSDPAQVTLSVSDAASGVATTYYVVDGGLTSQTYSGPFNVSGEGSHNVSFWSIDSAGNSETPHTLVVKVDGSAPSTQLSVAGTAGTNGWWLNPSVQVSLAASDASSGVATTYYTVDGGATQTYSAAFTVSGNGQHQVAFWSVDRVGNTEVQKSSTVKIDNEGPTTQNSVTGPGGGGNYFTGPITMSLTATDSVSGVAAIYYRIDNGATQTYSAPFAVTGDGVHPVNFWSIDNAGNSNYSYTVQIRIDATAPTAQSALSPAPNANGWLRTPVEVALSATDNQSGVSSIYYQVDNGASGPYSAPFTVSSAGVHTVYFWSYDVAGNTSGTKTQVIKIDGTVPVTQAAASGTTGTNGWYRGPVTVSLTASDNLSGVAARYYKVDGGATQVYSTAFSVSASGNHTINYWSMDLADNSETMRSLVVKIDVAGPVITASANPSTAPKSIKNVTVTISGSVTDSPSGVKPSSTTYSVVDEYGANQPSGNVTLQTNGSYSFSLSLPATRKGNDNDGHLYTFTVRSYDQAGNTNTASTTLRIQ
jgi:hypothetical protein